MRVYLPATLRTAAGVLRAGEIGPPPLVAFAVTPALREWYVSGDTEELEYAAMSAAALASLRLLAEDTAAPRRRMVLAADVPDGDVTARADLDALAEATLAAAVPLRRVAAVHVDDPDAADDVAAAVGALPAADAGDPDAEFLVDGAEGHELLWYATQELADLVAADAPDR